MSRADQLDAYLDGRLPAEDAAAFERALDGDAALRGEVELQRRLDASLRRDFLPPGAQRAAEILRAAGVVTPTQPARRLRFSIVRPFAIAAVIVLVCVGGWQAYRRAYQKWRTTPDGFVRVEYFYNERVARGFDPNQTCDNDQDFASAIWRTTDQGLVLRPLEGVEAYGFVSCACMGRYSLVLLADVLGEPVMVFITKTKLSREQQPPERSGLRIFRRDVGPATLHELTPHDKPYLLDLFYDPQKPREWYKISGW